MENENKDSNILEIMPVGPLFIKMEEPQRQLLRWGKMRKIKQSVSWEAVWHFCS